MTRTRGPLAPGSARAGVPQAAPDALDVLRTGGMLAALLRYVRPSPVGERVSRRRWLEDVDAAEKQSITPDSMKVVNDPWA